VVAGGDDHDHDFAGSPLFGLPDAVIETTAIVFALKSLAKFRIFSRLSRHETNVESGFSVADACRMFASEWWVIDNGRFREGRSYRFALLTRLMFIENPCSDVRESK
jgi:hypothetical protein